jgi:hypothetical protein
MPNRAHLNAVLLSFLQSVIITTWRMSEVVRRKQVRALLPARFSSGFGTMAVPVEPLDRNTGRLAMSQLNR